MNPSVFFKIKDSHFMGQIAVSIWPDFQGDWDKHFFFSFHEFSKFQYDPIFKGIETFREELFFYHF